jgi:hypothetical protein
MTDAWLRGKFEARAGACVAAALVAALVAGAPSARPRGDLPGGLQLAEADRGDGRIWEAWFRLGDLLANVVRRNHDADDDLQPSGGDRAAPDVVAPLDFDVHSQTPSVPRR